MKIAVLGGSFNPIHLGHLALADEVCQSLSYTKVLFVPTYNPPHKQAFEMLSAENRLNMVKIACSYDNRFDAEDCELRRKGTSYTYDTILYLQEKYKNQLEEKIALVLGEDLFFGFHNWYHAKELSELCTLVLAHRPQETHESGFSNIPIGNYALKASENWSFLDEPLFKDAIHIQNPRLQISSTEIRARIAQGKSFKYLVPNGVFEYITERGLYGASTPRK